MGKYNIDDNKETITRIIDEYIENCFDRDVIFFRGISNEYINSITEKELLKELIDNCITNMSPLIRKKLGLYFGEENIDIMIGRRCFSIVSMFVAQHNKNIYVKQ